MAEDDALGQWRQPLEVFPGADNDAASILIKIVADRLQDDGEDLRPSDVVQFEGGATVQVARQVEIEAEVGAHVREQVPDVGVRVVERDG